MGPNTGLQSFTALVSNQPNQTLRPSFAKAGCLSPAAFISPGSLSEVQHAAYNCNGFFIIVTINSIIIRDSVPGPYHHHPLRQGRPSFLHSQIQTDCTFAVQNKHSFRANEEKRAKLTGDKLFLGIVFHSKASLSHRRFRPGSSS